MTDSQIWRDALNLGHLKIYASLLDFSNDDNIDNTSTYIDLFNAMVTPSILILAPGYYSFPNSTVLDLPGNGVYIHFKPDKDRNFGLYAYGTKNNATNRNLKLSRIYVDENDNNTQKILWSTITTTA